MSRSIPWILSALLAAAVAVLSVQLGRFEAEVAGLRGQLARDSVTLKQDQRHTVELMARMARAKSNESTATAGAADAKQGEKEEDKSDGMTVIHMKDVIRDHPEMADLWRKQARTNMLRQYGDAIAGMHLPGDQADKLKNLLVERDASVTDARDAAAKAGIKPGTPEMAQATAQAAAEVQQQITGLIGPEGNAQLQAGVGASNNSYTVNNYGYALTDAGVPLSGDQSKTLAQLLYASNSAAVNTGVSPADARKPDPTTWLTPADQQFLSSAAAVVSPAQLEILRTQRADDNRRQSVMRPYYGNGRSVMISD